MNVSALFAVTLLAAPGAEVQDQVAFESAESSFGAVAPAAMRPGTVAVYGLLGAPDVSVGYRQGLAWTELEAKVSFNYLLASATAEVGARLAVLRTSRIDVAPVVAVGFTLNSGTRYYDPANVGYVGIRPRVGLVTSIHLTELLSGLVVFDVPWAFGFNGAHHATPTAGFGAELQLNKTLSAVLLGQLGAEISKEPVGFLQTRAGWAVRLGFGWRFF